METQNSYSYNQPLMTSTTEVAKILIDHILINSLEKVTQSGFIEMRLSDHKPIYCSRKMSLLKVNQHLKNSLRSMKNSSNEILVENLKPTKFFDY